MNLSELESTVFAAKPEFKRILEEHGAKTLLEYYRLRHYAPRELPAGRKQELFDTVYDVVKNTLGPEVAADIRNQLDKNYTVSTAGHHDTVTHPFFANNVLMEAYAGASRGEQNVIVFSCGGISLTNSSFPRGFLLRDNQGREDRLHLVTRKHHHHPVYGRAGFTAEGIANVIDELNEASFTPIQRDIARTVIKETYGSPEVLGLPYLSQQLTRGIFNFWKKVPGLANTNVVYLEQETIVAELLRRHHLNEQTILSALLFDEKIRARFLKNFDGIVGAFDSKTGKGTHLFWGVTPKTRVSLRVRNGHLVSDDSDFSVTLTPEAIGAALENKTLMPSMALSFSVLSFYYGLACAGGFSQVNYLADMKRAYETLLTATPSLSANSHELAHIRKLPTDFFAGEFILGLLGISDTTVAATPLDLIIYGNKKTDALLRKLARTVTLRQAVTPMLPELYKIVTGKTPDIKIPVTHAPCATIAGKCYYCGNNPVPHVVARINEYITLSNKPLEWLGTTPVGRFAERLLDWVAVPLARLGALVGAVRYNTDPHKAPTGRSQVIWEEAQKRSIPMKQIILFGKTLDIYEAQLNNRTIIFESLPVPAHLRTGALQWMDDKLELKRRLVKADLPVARGGAFDRFGPMRELFNKIDKPVIVKPAIGSRGRHTTTFIYTEEQLRQAFDIGKQISRRMVMEEHLVGSVYRATIIGGKLLGVLRGDPPRITGDGKSSISRLIEVKNQNRHPKVKEFKIIPLTEKFLARNNYTLAAVLPAGKTIDLTEKIGVSYGGFSAEEFTICHPETKKILEEVGRVVDFPTMGFDFIIQDITRSPHEQKWGVIECNSLPFIDLHHHPAEGEPINVAAHVWDLWG